MQRQLKVLFFVDRLLFGGVQALFSDIFKHNDNSRMSFEVLMLDDGVDYPFAEQISSMGITIHQLKGVWMRTPLDFIKYFKAVDKFFALHHDYDVVHLHSSSKNYYVLKVAQRYGIKVRVAHAHSTGFMTKNPLSKVVGDLMKRPLVKYSTHRCGCSIGACEWLFGKGSVDNAEARVVLNGVDSKIFSLDDNIRSCVREELGLQGKFVVGNVGRFERQKNHAFLIDIFSEVVKRNPDSALVLVGSGSLQGELEQKVAALSLNDKVHFLGFRSDRERIMQAMDVFVFPSLYEGLGIVLIEAQISGMPLFTATGVPRDLEVLPDITYKPLSQSASEWAAAIIGRKNTPRRDMTCEVVEAGFDIETMIDNLYKMYTE